MRQDGSVVVLATGGTIAGVAASATDNIGYQAASLGVEDLLRRVPGASQGPVETEQVAQIDSKDMEPAVWQRLAQRVAHHLARPEVAALVITHGTDTLEETAWFLERVLRPARPVVLVAAMRPATSLQADGPQNLCDGLIVARDAGRRGAGGVMAVLGGRVWPAAGLRKLHPYRLDALQAGDAGALGSVEEGRVDWWRTPPEWPELPAASRDAAMALDPQRWPRVAVLASHAGADGTEVAALQAAGFRGLVVAGTGHATLHRRLEDALAAAQRQGLVVWPCSRCLGGEALGGVAPADAFALTPWQARVELQLRLLA